MAISTALISNSRLGNLGKPDSEQMWQSITDLIPDSILSKPGVRILCAASGHGTEAIIIAKRMIALGISKEQVNESIWLIDSCRIFTNYVKLKYGFKNVVKGDFMTWDTNLKFDVALSNPPYNRSIKSTMPLPFTNIGPHSAFTAKSHELLKNDGIFAVVLPCNFMCLPSAATYRQWWLNNFEIQNLDIHDNTNGKVFDIGLSDIVTIVAKKANKPDNTNVKWNESFTVDLTKYSVWPMYKTQESVTIFDKLMASKTQDIPYTGDKNDKPTAHIVSTHLTRLGQRQNPNPKGMFVKDAIKNVSIPFWLGYSSKKQKDYQWNWMSTDHYAYVLSLVQSTPKNQPILFRMLGEHCFTDNDFVKHFNLSTQELAAISSWKQSFKSS